MYWSMEKKPLEREKKRKDGPSRVDTPTAVFFFTSQFYGVCGYLLDSLSAWDHSYTLLKPEQARFGRFYGIMFFRKDLPQTEGRRDADLGSV